MVLLDGGRTYLGVVEDLICHAKQLLPSFDQGQDESTNWTEIAREQCEVSLPFTLLFPLLSSWGYALDCCTVAFI